MKTQCYNKGCTKNVNIDPFLLDSKIECNECFKKEQEAKKEEKN